MSSHGCCRQKNNFGARKEALVEEIVSEIKRKSVLKLEQKLNGKKDKPGESG